MEKQRIREEILAKRAALSPGVRKDAARRIAALLAAYPAFRDAHTVLLYRAVRGEAELSPLPVFFPEKRFLYPHCLPERQMEALLPGKNADGSPAWRPGAFGIPEPDPNKAEIIPPEAIELVLCPCTAFDRSGTRLGMGAGYYDRFLIRCKNAVIGAAAYAFQEAQFSPEIWDVPMDFIVTERELIRITKESL